MIRKSSKVSKIITSFGQNLWRNVSWRSTHPIQVTQDTAGKSEIREFDAKVTSKEEILRLNNANVKISN